MEIGKGKEQISVRQLIEVVAIITGIVSALSIAFQYYESRELVALQKQYYKRYLAQTDKAIGTGNSTA